MKRSSVAVRFGGLVAGLAVVSLTLVGCGSAGSASSGSKSIGLVGFDASVVASAVETDAAAKAMKDAGWNVHEQDPRGDASQANSLCTQYVSQKVNAVVVSTFDASQMAACLATARAANIPVFFLASAELKDGMAGAISVSAEKPVNDEFAKYLANLKNPRILSLQYAAGAPCLLRANYFDKVIKEAGIPRSDIQVNQVEVPGQVTDAQNATTAWLNAHPASDGQDLVIWTCFSDPALGANAALKQANRQVPIFTWDVTPQLVNLVKSGAIHTTGINDPAGMGSKLVDMIKSYLSGKKATVEPAPFVILDKANINSYLSSHPGAIG